MLVQCANKIIHQLPNENTRVTLLLDGIECSDAALQAAMALVKNDTEPDGKANNFEATVAFILPEDPVAKRKPAKATTAEISDTTASSTQHSSSGGSKIGRGKKTGVHLRWHTSPEFAGLSRNEMQELNEFRNELKAQGKGRMLPVLPQHKKIHAAAQARAKSFGTKKRSDQRSNATAPQSKKLKALVAEAVAKLKDNMSSDDDSDIKDYILSVVKAAAPEKEAEKATKAPSKLSQILKRKKR